MGAIEEIKGKLDIVEVVSQYVGLQRSGANFKALCPFHTEKTPSFFVFPESQSWRCFGSCGSGGDLFSFIMKAERVDFGEALKLLAQRAGITLAQKRRNPEEEARRERLQEVNEAAVQYFHHQLLTSPAAKIARSHLEGRGITLHTIQDFQLGFSPWEGLHSYLSQREYSPAEQVDAGLLISGENGVHERFRHRLMFPIRNEHGRVVGFGGRALDDTNPKYLNSPQTPIFDKGSLLYGIDRAKAAIRQQNLAIIVEGYMDVIMAHQCGLANVVASMGIALTERQVGLLKKLTKNVTLALDADAAGKEAMLRGIEVAKQSFDQKTVPVPTWRGLIKYRNSLDAELRIIILPENKDPDEVIHESVSEWQHLVDNALPVVDYLFDQVTSHLNLSDPRDKSAAAEQLLPVVGEIKDIIEQSHYLQKLARLIQVEERILQASMPKIKGGRQGGKEGAESRSGYRPSSRPEEYCLTLLMRYPELKEKGSGLSADHFEHMENRQAFLAWRDNKDREALDDGLEDHLDRLMSEPRPPLDEKVVSIAFEDCFRQLEERRLRVRKLQEQVLLAEVEAGGGSDEAQRLACLQQEALEINARLGRIFRSRSERRTIPQIVAAPEA